MKVLKLGECGDYPAVLEDAVKAAFRESSLSGVDGLEEALEAAGGTEVLLVLPAGRHPEAESMADEAGLPRWGVVRFGGEAWATGPWTVPQLAGVLRQAAEIHKLKRGSARMSGDLLTVAGRLSHDLRTPLGGIMATADMLAELYPEEAASLKGVLGSADEIRHLLNRAGVVLRATAVPLRPTRQNMAVAAGNAAARLERLALDKTAVIRWPERWPEVSGVTAWLEVVWWNLLHNALVHGGASPELELGWRNTGDTVEFSVVTGGVGSEAEAGPVWPEFSLLHHPDAGRGLGLAIVRRLVELMNGQTGRRIPPGGGVCYWFALPRVEA